MAGRLETVTVDAGSEETVTVPEMVWVAGKLEMVTAEKVTLEVPEIEMEPLMGWVAGKFEIETTLPLTAVVISEIAFAPRLTTLWATICSPPVTTEERVVAVWLPSKTRRGIFLKSFC